MGTRQTLRCLSDPSLRSFEVHVMFASDVDRQYLYVYDIFTNLLAAQSVSLLFNIRVDLFSAEPLTNVIVLQKLDPFVIDTLFATLVLWISAVNR